MVGGSRARAYKLVYSLGGFNKSRLASVQQYGRNATLDGTGTVTGGTSLPATTFTWNAEPTGSMSQVTGPTNFCSGPNLVLTPGVDINVDGKDDMHCHDKMAGQHTVALSNGNGSFQIVNNAITSWCSGGYTTHLSDFNGDGRMDLLCPIEGMQYMAQANANGTF